VAIRAELTEIDERLQGVDGAAGEAHGAAYRARWRWRRSPKQLFGGAKNKVKLGRKAAMSTPV
jgi:hypothetical protein